MFARLRKLLRETGERRQVWARRKRLAANIRSGKSRCVLCGERPRLRIGYDRPFEHCQACGFIYTRDIAEMTERAMGMVGSWSGPSGGGYREQWLAEFMRADFGKTSTLLFGTGNTPTFALLRDRGWDVVGADITDELVAFKQTHYGRDAFVHGDRLPDRTFDVIIAVEVLEHLKEPRQDLARLAKSLSPTGVICGTTNFYLGGPIEDINDPGYMSHELHLCYWSESSMRFAAAQLGMQSIAFQLERPGSVYPDDTYGQLWPNKRVFFLCKDPSDFARLEARFAEYPILPIDRS